MKALVLTWERMNFSKASTSTIGTQKPEDHKLNKPSVELGKEMGGPSCNFAFDFLARCCLRTECIHKSRSLSPLSRPEKTGEPSLCPVSRLNYKENAITVENDMT